VSREKAGLLAAGTLATAAATQVPWLRVAAGLLLVLVLPGYSLVALLPDGMGRPSGFSPLLWRVIWTSGLSLVVAVLGGLLLNLIPAGLTRDTWTLMLTAVTLAASGAAAWPWSRAPVPGQTGSRARRPVPRAALGYAVAALAVAGTATGLAVASAGWEHSPGFAQLWLVPVPGGAINLGVRNQYADTETFRLTLRRGEHVISDWDLSLGPGQDWRRTVPEASGQVVTAQLTTGRGAAAQTVTGRTG
jgi:Protein of unknown function (DUF1616)